MYKILAYFIWNHETLFDPAINSFLLYEKEKGKALLLRKYKIYRKISKITYPEN